MEEAMELVFIPFPVMGHLKSAVQMANLLLQKRNRLSIKVLIMKLPFQSEVNSYTHSLLVDNEGSRLKFIQLPEPHPSLTEHTHRTDFFHLYIRSHQPCVRDCVNEIKNSSASVRLAGLVVDVFCSVMIDVANEIGVPTYVFYTSGAAMLGLHLHLQSLRDDDGIDVTEFKDSDPDLNVSTYSKPFPVKLLPLTILDKTGGSTMFLDIAKPIREAKGLMVNTFFDLEPHALESLSKDGKVPLVYHVGPLLNVKIDENRESVKEVLTWLDAQPDSSVVFLCFGSTGSFPEPQVKEIACALERTGQRFLWTLRRPPPEGEIYPTDYNNPEEILSEGFLKRTKSMGKVIGWAPQTAVLAHPAVGGFVSHCGWNSTLESLWFGVPMAAWPMYAEQQANAFQLITDVGMVVEVKMDYNADLKVGDTKLPCIVSSKDIELGITNLMDHSSANLARIRAKELKEKSRKALEEGGSSFKILESFFESLSL